MQIILGLIRYELLRLSRQPLLFPTPFRQISFQLLSNSLAAINHCRIYIETSNGSSMGEFVPLYSFPLIGVSVVAIMSYTSSLLPYLQLDGFRHRSFAIRFRSGEISGFRSFAQLVGRTSRSIEYHMQWEFWS